MLEPRPQQRTARMAPYVSSRLFAAPSKPQLRLRQLSPQLAQTRGKTVIVPVNSQQDVVTRADDPGPPKSAPRKPCISSQARTPSQYRYGLRRVVTYSCDAAANRASPRRPVPMCG